MNLVTILVAALLAAAPIAASAQTTQPGPGWSMLKTYDGMITRVDAAARTVTARDVTGETSVFEAPPSMASSQLATFVPGDKVTVTFYDGFEVRRPGATPMASSVDPATGLRNATVTVTKVDTATRTLTFIGPRGTYTRRGAGGVDAGTLQMLTVASKVDLAYFEYVLSMTHSASTAAASSEAPAAPAPAAGDSLKDRMTVFFLYGVDNSFTGKMIQAATGKTTTGVPINLTETSFDDVYGRLGMLKIGVGYLMTPRIEGVANFVYSNSAASFEATPIGTAGATGQVPLNVNFTNYRYVGAEVGQRFLFPRGRVTPFAGWLVDVNRNQDIRGTFAGVPQSSLRASRRRTASSSNARGRSVSGQPAAC